jgi:hypothetical protein
VIGYPYYIAIRVVIGHLQAARRLEKPSHSENMKGELTPLLNLNYDYTLTNFNLTLFWTGNP